MISTAFLLSLLFWLYPCTSVCVYFLLKKPWSWPVWLSWLEHHPINHSNGHLIPGQGTYLGCRFNPQSEHVWEATNQCSYLISMSLSLFPPLSLFLFLFLSTPTLCLKSINIFLIKKQKEKALTLSFVKVIISFSMLCHSKYPLGLWSK